MYLASSIAPHGSYRPELYDGLLSVQTFAVLNHHYNDGVTLDSFIDWMTEARYPMEHEPDYARATATEPTGGSACLQSTPQIARSQGIDSSAFVAAVSRLPMQHVPHIDGAYIDTVLQDLKQLGLL